MSWITRIPIGRLFAVAAVFATALLIGCSSPNSEAPSAGQVHTDRYILSHAADAAADLESCQSCHGADLNSRGANAGGAVPSCFICHEAQLPITIHPLPYSDPAEHGAAARSDQLQCVGCHGSDSTRFDGGILSDPDLYNIPEANCSAAACHPTAGAHPTRWSGSNDITGGYNASHRNVTRVTIEESCSACHDVTQGRIPPNAAAPSCFAASYINGDGSTSGCHASGPGAAHELPFADPEIHGAAAKADLAACQVCHGVTGTTDFDGGTSGTACSTCHPDAGAHPTNWQGANDSTAGYLSSHRSAGKQSSTCAICHDVSSGRTAPNSNAPSCFAAGFTNADNVASGCHAAGPSAPHALPFTDPTLHGPDAKADLTSCLPCHATPADAGPGDNPRFNVAIGNLANGCEDCHQPFSAHPLPLWDSAATSHKTAGAVEQACALCHGADLNGAAQGGVGPACVQCHTAGSPLVLQNCTSCHNAPPDSSAPAGTSYPNRNQSHDVHQALTGIADNCGVCHSGAGTDSANHFDAASPADVVLSSTYNAQTGSAAYNAPNCSSVRCHGGQTTPAWGDTGSIDVASDCLSCHRINGGQYNSPTSSVHTRSAHSGFASSCATCHDASALAGQHFVNLATAILEGDPADTIHASLRYTGSDCTTACH